MFHSAVANRRQPNLYLVCSRGCYGGGGGLCFPSEAIRLRGNIDIPLNSYLSLYCDRALHDGDELLQEQPAMTTTTATVVRTPIIYPKIPMFPRTFVFGSSYYKIECSPILVGARNNSSMCD